MEHYKLSIILSVVFFVVKSSPAPIVVARICGELRNRQLPACLQATTWLQRDNPIKLTGCRENFSILRYFDQRQCRSGRHYCRVETWFVIFYYSVYLDGHVLEYMHRQSFASEPDRARYRSCNRVITYESPRGLGAPQRLTLCPR